MLAALRLERNPKLKLSLKIMLDTCQLMAPASEPRLVLKPDLVLLDRLPEAQEAEAQP